MNISEKFFISLTVQIHIWPLLARFLHDAFTEHHKLASQEWLRLGSDVLHMAILILNSAEFLGSWGVWPLFLAVSKDWAGSNSRWVCALLTGTQQPGLVSLTCLGTAQVRFPTASTPELPPSHWDSYGSAGTKIPPRAHRMLCAHTVSKTAQVFMLMILLYLYKT